MKTSPSAPRTRALLVIALLVTVLGGLVVVLTALGMGQADVRGVPLRGALRAAFLAGSALAVAATAAAAAGLRRGRDWGVGLLAAVWPGYALLCLALDRWSPAPGPGRPLAFYLLGVGLLPAAATLLLGRSGRAGGDRR